MFIHEIGRPEGANRNRKRVGRGSGSLGKTSGRGHKGAQSRSGYKSKRGFEGGQMPLHRRLPKQGFTSIFKKQYRIINLFQLDRLTESEITPEMLMEKSLISGKKYPLRVLGKGEISRAITVKAHYFSKNAKEKIEAAGGKAEVV
mgnify:CR=1 FL=1